MSWRVEAQDPALVLAVTVNANFSMAHFLARRWAARASRSRRRARLESGLSDANWKAFRTEAALKSKRSLLSLYQFALQRASGGRSCWPARSMAASSCATCVAADTAAVPERSSRNWARTEAANARAVAGSASADWSRRPVVGGVMDVGGAARGVPVGVACLRRLGSRMDMDIAKWSESTPNPAAFLQFVQNLILVWWLVMKWSSEKPFPFHWWVLDTIAAVFRF